MHGMENEGGIGRYILTQLCCVARGAWSTFERTRIWLKEWLWVCKEHDVNMIPYQMLKKLTWLRLDSLMTNVVDLLAI